MHENLKDYGRKDCLPLTLSEFVKFSKGYKMFSSRGNAFETKNNSSNRLADFTAVKQERKNKIIPNIIK